MGDLKGDGELDIVQAGDERGDAQAVADLAQRLNILLAHLAHLACAKSVLWNRNRRSRNFLPKRNRNRNLITDLSGTRTGTGTAIKWDHRHSIKLYTDQLINCFL
jgi:hypothetical protein